MTERKGKKQHRHFWVYKRYHSYTCAAHLVAYGLTDLMSTYNLQSLDSGLAY